MWHKKNFMIFMLIVILNLAILPAISVWAQEEEPAPAGDETGTFTTASAPDVLLILDLSYSMAAAPPNESYEYEKPYKYGNTTSCSPDTTSCACTVVH
jgi:hypothetical protein